MVSQNILQEELAGIAGKRVEVKINDNHSTMLSVKWEPECTKVSLHRMFLKAPQNIMEELACYLKREDRIISPSVKAFIEDNLKEMDYSHTLKKEKLYQQGTVYNLKKIYDDLNAEYFQNKLNLLITWFGKYGPRNRSRVTFGLYHDPLKLIKIHRLLDTPSFPNYFVAYVVYHEMLHAVCPAYVDEKGQNRVHSREFKEKEAQFRYYHLAQRWIKEHQANLFD